MTLWSQQGCILLVFFCLLGTSSSIIRCVRGEETTTSKWSPERQDTDRLLFEDLPLLETEFLLGFRDSITEDPSSNFLLGNWNLTVQPNICNWTGITCDDDSKQHVVSLKLSGNNLRGSISPLLGGLRFLQTLDLSDNKFTGAIPSSLGFLDSLLTLDLSNNELQGIQLPVEITNCTSLVHLDLSNNLIPGPLPSNLGTLANLQWLDLSNNDFTGEIPASLGSCSELQMINLGRNHLTGGIPPELGNLAHLEILTLFQNSITGTIPALVAIGCQNLTHLDLSWNRLYGEIIPEIGQLQMLKFLQLQYNTLNGSIPASIGNCTSLNTLILGPNSNLTGVIPVEIGRLERLTSLVISGTGITGAIPSTLGDCTDLRKLQLTDNELGGEIPAELGKCLNLTVLELANNKLTGEIPSVLGALRNLGRFDARFNELTGRIPPELGLLRSLVELYLSGNNLTGSLISEIGSLTYLEKLSLNDNFFSGSLPSSLGNCSVMIELNLSGNEFSGALSGKIIEGLRSVSYLYLQDNHFSGSIPKELGSLEFITVLDLSQNDFSGSIPPSLGKCTGLMLLNVSKNHLTGELPASLSSLSILISFSAAYNNLSGPIPLKGFFANLTELSLAGNPRLCGAQVNRNCTILIGTLECNGDECGRSWVYAVSGAAGFVLAVLVLGFILWIRGERIRMSSRNYVYKGGSRPEDLNICTSKLQLQLTVEELLTSTEGFSDRNILGRGGYSTVYKGVLASGVPIAVKRLNLESEEEHDLSHELQILRGLRHKNLVEVYGFVFAPEFRALVMEFIPNGSLHMHLHHKGKMCRLSWDTRVNIAIGVADAMIHLHHECHEPIIHRDLKPSNILLDPDFHPRVADFGIAKNVTFDGNGETTASGLFGTTGYIAPEYATSNKVSTKGDVYSYGVVILEMVTRRQPTDDTFTPGTWLSLWVLEAFPDRIHEIVDSSLKQVYKTREREIHMLIRIGLLCTNDVPNERPSMKEVREMLAQLRDPNSRLTNRARNYPSMSELVDLQHGRYPGSSSEARSNYDTDSSGTSYTDFMPYAIGELGAR